MGILLVVVLMVVLEYELDQREQMLHHAGPVGPFGGVQPVPNVRTRDDPHAELIQLVPQVVRVVPVPESAPVVLGRLEMLLVVRPLLRVQARST